VRLWIHVFWSVNEALTLKSHFKWSLLVHLSKWFKGNGWQRFLSLEEFRGEPWSFFRKVGKFSIFHKCSFPHTLELFPLVLLNSSSSVLSTYCIKVLCLVRDSEKDIIPAFIVLEGKTVRWIQEKNQWNEIWTQHVENNSECVCLGGRRCNQRSHRQEVTLTDWVEPGRVAKMESWC
jgi:hypothetical protein